MFTAGLHFLSVFDISDISLSEILLGLPCADKKIDCCCVAFKIVYRQCKEFSQFVIIFVKKKNGV